jgi:aminoglycoside phosphotransferase (APT) family kinase protein
VLATVPAPPEVPCARADPYAGDRLLHLDLHPFNVLVDAGGAVTGVLDWANTAAGHPDLDRARTAAILTGDPAARRMAGDPVAAALFDGWARAADFAGLPAAATAWARDHMLADLAPRYGPAELAAVAAALDAAPGPG